MSNASNRPPRKRPQRSIAVQESSGNVFADLGVSQSSEAFAKAEIAARIAEAIKKRGLTQVRAAALLHITQADVSDLVRGKLKGFSTERLFRFLNALGKDIEIVILEHPAKRQTGSLRVLDEYPRRAAAGSRSKR